MIKSALFFEWTNIKFPCIFVIFVIFSLTFLQNNSIIDMYYFEREKSYAKKILEKDRNVNINNSMCI